MANVRPWVDTRRPEREVPVMTSANVTRRDELMEQKLEQIERDPVAYYARARKAAYREEMRKALIPWRDHRRKSASA